MTNAHTALSPSPAARQHPWLGGMQRLTAVAAALVAVAMPTGCRKKADPVEAVATGNAPMVKKKSRDAGATAAAPLPSEATRMRAPTNDSPTAPVAAIADAAAIRPAPGPEAATPETALAPVQAPSAEPPAGAAAAPASAPAGRAGAGSPLGSAAPEAAPPLGALRPAAEAPGAEGPAPEAPVLPVGAPPVAAAEPPPERPGALDSGEPPLDITGYLSTVDVTRVLGDKAKLRRSELPGAKPSPTYNVLYFQPEKGDQFGLAVQVWRDSNLAESRTRFNTMRNTYSNVAPTNKVTDQGFRAFFGGVVSLVFADQRRPLVVAVNCSTKTCTADQLIELSNRVNERLR